MQKRGWAVAPHKLPPEILGRLVKKKDEFLTISFVEAQKAFKITLNGFESEKVEYIELAKAITRALLRYDPDSFLLARAIWKELKETFKLKSEIQYLGAPYPIIHLPEDTSEIGGRHKDDLEYIKYFYTTWTPLNDCFHQPLSIFENTHKKNNFFIRQLRIRLPFVNKLILSTKKELKPDIRLGEFFLWPGRTDHQGLLNKSGKTTVAMITSFSSSPIMNGPSLTVEEIEKYVAKETNIDTLSFVQKMISAWKEIRAESWENIEKTKNLGELTADVRRQIKKWNFSPEESKRFAFVCVLWAQRLIVKMDVTVFYFYAFFSAGDNFNALHACIRYAIDHFKTEEIKVFADSILRDFASKQAVFEIKSAIKLSGEKGRNLNIKYPENLALLKP